jgi:hypothetical protein
MRDAQFTPHVIPKGLVGQLVKYYWSIGEYRTSTMNKADPGKALEWVLPYIQKIYGVGEFLGGNFYRHSLPYLPHTDHQKEWGKSVNVVLPLHVTDTMTPFLIVFDQIWDGDPVTWTLDYPVTPGKISSSTNSQFAGRVCDFPGIQRLTNRDMDETFAKEFLPRNRELYFGLTGRAFPFITGGAIIFPNNQIHCTSKFAGEKIGLSLRFKEQ